MILRTMLGVVATIFLLSCGISDQKVPAGIASQREASQTPSISVTDIKPNDLVSREDFEKGKELVVKSDCLGCHHQVKKLIGPSYLDIANKYTFNTINTDTLSQKIVNGGVGIWSDVPMLPHVGLSPVDAKQMVLYIYSFKNN